MLLATTFLTFLWSLIVIFFMVIFFILLFHVIIDLFSRHDASGLKKTAWVIFLIVLPFLGLFVYYITNADGMAQRQMKAMTAAAAGRGRLHQECRVHDRPDSADRAGQGPARRRDDHAGRVRQAEGKGARLNIERFPRGQALVAASSRATSARRGITLESAQHVADRIPALVVPRERARALGRDRQSSPGSRSAESPICSRQRSSSGC